MKPCLQTTQILNLAEYLDSTVRAPDSYSKVAQAVFDSPKSDTAHVTAFEENRLFVYAVARMQSHESVPPSGQTGEKIAPWVRRLIILNSSTYIVDDDFLTPISPGVNAECVSSPTAPQISGGEAHITEGSREISVRMLFPTHAVYQVRGAGQGQAAESYFLETSAPDKPIGTRFLQILHVGKAGQEGKTLQSELTPTAANWKLTITDGDRMFHLALPPPAEEAGDIAITNLEGKTLVATRPLPSGILPHGPRGTRLLEHWDSAYRTGEAAPWDIGRPADELQKVISAGKISKCRAVDLCCGSGTDAIYMARQGFDVTGIDISPTALGRRNRKPAKPTCPSIGSWPIRSLPRI